MTATSRMARLGLAALAGAAFLGCGASPVAESLERAESYFSQQVRTVDPGWANLIGYLHRRYGLELVNASGAALHEVPAAQARPEIADLYRRLVDPNARVSKQQIADLESVIDRITASALHCDRIPLPEDWVGILSKVSEAGGYALTHATLAGVWTLENGCRTELALAPLQTRQVEALVAMAGDTVTLRKRFDAALDIWVEALVMLYYLDAGDQVEAGWIDQLIWAQRPDGGWPRHPAAIASDPHTTALALWVLLENLHPDQPAIRWIP